MSGFAEFAVVVSHSFGCINHRCTLIEFKILIVAIFI